MMILVIASAAAALAIYLMGMHIGRKQAEQHFLEMRGEMGLTREDNEDVY